MNFDGRTCILCSHYDCSVTRIVMNDNYQERSQFDMSRDLIIFDNCRWNLDTSEKTKRTLERITKMLLITFVPGTINNHQQA